MGLRLHVLRAFEHQVLEQMGESGPPRLLVLRADVIGEIHVHDWRRVILGQCQCQAVGQRRQLVLQLRRANRSGGHTRCAQEHDAADTRGDQAAEQPSLHGPDYLLSRRKPASPHRFGIPSSGYASTRRSTPANSSSAPAPPVNRMPASAMPPRCRLRPASSTSTPYNCPVACAKTATRGVTSCRTCSPRLPIHVYSTNECCTTRPTSRSASMVVTLTLSRCSTRPPIVFHATAGRFGRSLR